MEDCRQLVTLIPQTTIRHVFREANRCVDKLANLGLNLDADFTLFSSPAMDLFSCLEANSHGFLVSSTATGSILNLGLLFSFE